MTDVRSTSPKPGEADRKTVDVSKQSGTGFGAVLATEIDKLR